MNSKDYSNLTVFDKLSYLKKEKASLENSFNNIAEDAKNRIDNLDNLLDYYYREEIDKINELLIEKNKLIKDMNEILLAANELLLEISN